MTVIYEFPRQSYRDGMATYAPQNGDEVCDEYGITYTVLRTKYTPHNSTLYVYLEQC